MTRIRTAQLSDLEGMLQVSVRNGLSPFDPAEMRQRLLSHPFRKEFEGAQMGWVLEDDRDGIVGTFSNIHMMYEINGARLKCGVASCWAVDIRHRQSSLGLAMAFLNQEGVDFCINGSASAVVSKLMNPLGASRIPSPDHDLGYFWILRPVAFAKAALLRKKVPAAAMASLPAGAYLWATDVLRGRRRRTSGTVRDLTAFGPEFNALWDCIRQGPGVLRAVRTKEALEWRYGAALRRKSAVLLGQFDGHELQGYVVLKAKDREELGLKQYIVDDLQARNDSPEILANLLVAAIEASRSGGQDALEWSGRNQAKRHLAMSLTPRVYRYGTWRVFYKALDSKLEDVLNRAEAWDFSPHDSF
jgi:hypothetical protein